MDYTGGERKDFENQERPVFGPEVFGGQPEQQLEATPETENQTEDVVAQGNDNVVEMSMPPGMETINPEEQAVTTTEEIEQKEHKSAKIWATEVRENIERDGDNPRKLQEDWVKNANKFIGENYNRHWGDRN